MTEHHLVREKHTIYNTLSSFQRASVATVGGLGCKDSAHADELTRLFTAAPDLLAALEEMRDIVYRRMGTLDADEVAAYDRAAEAVRKARGGEGEMNNPVMIKCASHRARGRLLGAFGKLQSYWAWDHPGNYGWFMIDKADLPKARAIKGVSAPRVDPAAFGPTWSQS